MSARLRVATAIVSGRGAFVCKIGDKKRTLNYLAMKRLFQVNWFGIASIVFSQTFQIYVRAPLGPRYSVYIDVAFVGIMSCAVPAALIAAWRGSKLCCSSRCSGRCQAGCLSYQLECKSWRRASAREGDPSLRLKSGCAQDDAA